MKHFSKTIILFAFTILVFAGCKREGNIFSEYDYIDPSSAFLKINYNVAFKNNPAAQIKINGVRVTGTNITTRYPFPGGGFNTGGGSTGDYLPIKPGSNEILISIPKKGTSADSVEIYRTTMNVETGKRYSLHVTDSLARKGVPIEENYSLPEKGTSRYRFVNLMPNLPAADLWIGGVKVVSNLPYLGVSEPFVLPEAQVDISNVWYLRVAGTVPATVGASIVATYTSSSTLLANRVFTVFATGYNGISTTATPLDARRPCVAFYYVR